MAIQPPTIGNGAEAGPSTTSRERSPGYKLVQNVSGHSRSVTALEWTHDGENLISAGADGLINFWSTTPPFLSLVHTAQIRAHLTGINDISISPDDLYVASASDDNKIHVYPVQTSPSDSNPPLSSSISPPLRILSGHTAPVLACAFSPKSNLIVSGSFDESAIVWDVRRGVALRQLPAHSEAVWTVGWDGEGVMVLTGSADGLIRLWDASTGQCLKTLDNETNSPVTSAMFTPNPFHLVAGTMGVVRVYNIHTGKVVKSLRPNASPTANPAGQAPATATIENKDTSSGAVVVAFMPALDRRLEDGEDAMEVDGLDEKRDAWVVATSGETGAGGQNVTIWELGTKRVVQVLEGQKGQVLALAVHPNGRLIVTGTLGLEKAIMVWRDQ